MSGLRLHRGRLLGCVHLRVSDLDAAKAFAVEALHHGPSTRSADSVAVEPA